MNINLYNFLLTQFCSRPFFFLKNIVAKKKEDLSLVSLNPLPDNKILGLPKFKAFADDKSNGNQNITVVFHRIENIVGKEENAGYQHFLLFPQCFQKAFFLQCVKSRHCVVMG